MPLDCPDAYNIWLYRASNMQLRNQAHDSLPTGLSRSGRTTQSKNVILMALVVYIIGIIRSRRRLFNPLRGRVFQLIKR